MSGRLEGRTAVVTGADSGIGKAIAEAFAAEGADVVIGYHRDREGAEDTSRRIAQQGRKGPIFQGDLQDPEEIEALWRTAEETCGTPDILVNNAGVNYSACDVTELSLEDWHRRIDVNLTAPFLLSKHFVAARRRAGGGGRIINISSVHEDIAMPGGHAYGASKGGLRMFMRTLALEVARDRINVNNIAPGMILTPMNQKAIDDPDYRRKAEAAIPWKRAGEPWEVARLAVYLASDDADYVTGQTFVIDGGLSLNVGQGA